jgi:hypothetical protein
VVAMSRAAGPVGVSGRSSCEKNKKQQQQQQNKIKRE